MMDTKKTFRISGTGCALVDYLYKPVNFTNENFTRFLSKKSGDGGLSPGKLVFTEEFEKFSGEPYSLIRNLITKNMDPVAVNIGGPSIVSLIHAAQLLENFPAEVRFYGCMGADPAGSFINEKLKLTPLKIGHYKTGNHFTPFTDVLSDPDYDNGHGERVFINNIGAAWEFLPEDLDDSFYSSDIVVFGGTALVPVIHSSLHELTTKAKSYGAITVVNTVFDFLNEKNNPDSRWPLGKSADTYHSIDLLITDMEEALRLSGTKTVDDAIAFFRAVGVGSLIITHGSNDLHFFSGGNLFGKVPPVRLPVSERVKAELKQGKGRVGDTTGCGDNFVGGVIASITKQLILNAMEPVNFREAIATGVASGGFTCFYNGGTYYEEFAGQKAQLINSYFSDYLSQIGLTGSSQDE